MRKSNHRRSAHVPKATPAKAAEVPDERHRVIIEGRVARMQVFNLPHDVYCKAMGVCSCSEQMVSKTVYSQIDKGQMRHSQLVKKLINSSLTVRFRQRVAVPRAVLACPEIKVALERKWLRVRS